jgi:putative toxin-antitoxin system antitoxin component (TIGR02293 family)
MDHSLEDRLSSRLGGALGLKSAADDVALARSDRKRLAAALIRTPAAERLLRPADVHSVVPRRTWIRRKASGVLDASEFDALYRVLRIRTLAALVFGSRAQAEAWLDTPKSRLVARRRFGSLATRSARQAVENWLHKTVQGFLA